MAAIDRADFNGDRYSARLFTGLAEAGHADEQGLSLRRLPTLCRNHFLPAAGAAPEADAGADEPAGADVVFSGGADEVAGGAAELAGGAVVLAGGCVEVDGSVPVGPGVELAGGGLDAPSTSPWCFDQNSAIKQNTIQIDAVTIVMRVNMSPAFAPNALDPPIPPRAPAKPPPRPRCTSTSRIKKIAKKDRMKAKSAFMVFACYRRSLGWTG